MADCIESKIDIRGTGLHLRRGGSGEPMLFLHGASGVTGWIPTFQALSESHDLMVPDHPTYGLSTNPTGWTTWTAWPCFISIFLIIWTSKECTSSVTRWVAGWRWKSPCATALG